MVGSGRLDGLDDEDGLPDRRGVAGTAIKIATWITDFCNRHRRYSVHEERSPSRLRTINDTSPGDSSPISASQHASRGFDTLSDIA